MSADFCSSDSAGGDDGASILLMMAVLPEWLLPNSHAGGYYFCFSCSMFLLQCVVLFAGGQY